jgi:hypothetical protein
MMKTPTEVGVLAEIPRLDDLKARIAARRRSLSDRLVELKFDTHLEAEEVRDALKVTIGELARLTKLWVVDGWGNISEPARRELDRWLDDSLAVSERRRT